jgi:hypothetical protein
MITRNSVSEHPRDAMMSQLNEKTTFHFDGVDRHLERQSRKHAGCSDSSSRLKPESKSVVSIHKPQFAAGAHMRLDLA